MDPPAPDSPPRFRKGAVGIFLIGLTALASALSWSQFQGKEHPKPDKAAAPTLNAVQRRYLEALADRLGVAHPKEWTAEEVLALNVQLNQQVNALTPAMYDAARTPWLRPMPPTLTVRTLERAQSAPLDLARGEIDFPAGATLYQYTIRNGSDRPRAMPILFQNVRWEAAEALVESSGLREIADEFERAEALWRFVAEHRAHGQPVTEGAEEHDLIKFLSIYGYGFCDDSAQALAVLAGKCGLRARIRGLNGHVVPEILVQGRWGMFDPDFAVYFHEPGNPRAVLGVDALEKDRAAFANARQLGAAGSWDGEYAAPFLSREDNREWALEGRDTYAIAHTLAPGEKVTFSSFNWGRYFVGAFPQKPPRFYNGTFEVPMGAASWQAETGAKVQQDGTAFTLEGGAAAMEFRFPFPIVGGKVSGLPPGVAVEFVEGSRRVALRGQGEFSLEAAVAQLTPSPTYAFRLRLVAPAGKTVRLAEPPRLVADFQFAELALLNLRPGKNRFQMRGATEGLQAEWCWK